MNPFFTSTCIIGCFLHTLTRCMVLASEFQLDGDYLIGGLFSIHHTSGNNYHTKPEAINCSRQHLLVSNYRRFQLMRFSVEEINNSSKLLPNVSLGYQIFDYCSDVQAFPGVFKIISVNGLIQPWSGTYREQTQKSNTSSIIAVVGPFTSTDTVAVAPLIMMDHTPLITYGATSSIFSEKGKYPSVLRTVNPNKGTIRVIVQILQHFDWPWVAFVYADNDFGSDGKEMFVNMIRDTEICLAHSQGLSDDTKYSLLFQQIELQRIHVIVVFAPESRAEALLESAIQHNVTEKVWIAHDGWALNKRLPKTKAIEKIGTVLGVSQPLVIIPGFSDFISSFKSSTHCENTEHLFCNQDCKFSSPSPDEINTADPSFSFPVYSAVYAIAHALHNCLQCETGGCNGNLTVNHHMVLSELRKIDFKLLNHRIRFDENGDPEYRSYSIVFWNQSGDAEEIGFYRSVPSFDFSIDNSKIKWFTNGEVPTSKCSEECPEGFAKKQDGIHKCCFTCELCHNGTYVNITEDPYTCVDCKETEWSTVASTSCKLRSVEYVPFTDTGAIVIMVAACAFVGLILAMSVLFAINFNTPVVRSAGGPMCFLILGCLCLCTISVFFYFGKPTAAFCIIRFLPFYLFYTPCLACFVVRSFQIVCIFKIAAKFPKLHTWWLKHNGQWMVITVSFVTQAVFLLIGYSAEPPVPYNNTFSYPDKIILGCDFGLNASFAPVIILLFLCSLCFIFSYMGKDLPKNYNEAKAITFCLLLLILTWTIYATINVLYQGKLLQILHTLAILSSVSCFLLWYFLPKCYIIIFQPQKNTQQYFQGLIQNYTKTMSQ